MAEIKKLTKKKYPVKLPHYDVSIDILKSSNGRDWSHDYYNIDVIHANGFTGAGVKVAVIDTGIDLTHSCFKKANEEGRIKTFDSRPRKNNPTDGNGHGSWVASRYIGTNSIVGFSPDVELYVYKALEDDGTGDIEIIIKAAKHAIDSGCHIISTSVGWPDDYPRFQSIVDYAESKNVLWISASGNDYSKDDIDYPAVLRYIISCGSINKKGKRSNFSDFGKELDLYSSGEDVIGAYTKNRNAVMDGTSMATPSLGALFSLVYFYIIEQYGSVNREIIKKIATCL